MQETEKKEIKSKEINQAEMKKKQRRKNIIYGVGAFAVVLTASVIVYMLNEKSEIKVSQENEPEKEFGGVKLNILSDLSRNVRKGEGCEIDEYGFLVCKYRSNSGKKIFRSQIDVGEDGKLVNLGKTCYGQIYTPADIFVKEANSKYDFTSEKIV